MNKILEDNIKYLANQGIEIDKNFTTEKVSYVQDLKGIDVPVLNVNGTKHMYSTVDALEGVKIQTSNLKILSANVLVVFGSGLLYEVYEVISKWKEEGFVLVIEPDEEVFKANILKCQLALNTDIAKIRFFVGSDFTEYDIYKFLHSNLELLWFYPLIFYSNLGYEKSFPKQYMECYRGVTKVAQKYGVTYVSYLRYHKQNVEAIGRNIKTFYEMGSSLASLRNLYKDKPAIIVASGPSLLNNIELLKDIQDKVLILAPYTSLKVIEPLGIKPDFVFSIDPNQVEEVHHKDIDSYNYNFVMDCAGNTSLLKKNTGNNFLYVDASSPHFRKYFNVENFGDANLDSGGSVANNAASFAHLVGCNRLILIGQDLAFKGERSHAYDDLLDDIETKRYKVKGFYGDEVETYRVYDTYKRWFESFGNVYGEKIHCINATEGGAYINYFEHMSFKEAIEMYLTESFDTTVPEEIIKKPTLQQTKDAIQIIQEEIDFYKTNIVKLRSIIKPVTKIKKAFEKDNDVDTSKFANDLKKLDKFDEFYKENRDKYQICKTVQYMTFLQHQVGFPLDFSADRIVAEKNYRHYTELLDGIELGHETLEKAKKDLVELTEGKDGVQ